MDLRDQLTVYEQIGWINMRDITFSFLDQTSSRGMEKIGKNIPTIPEVHMHTLNFKPNFKFSRSKVLWGDPHPHLGVHYQGLVKL